MAETLLPQKIQNLLAQYESSKLVLLDAAKKVERVVAASRTPWPGKLKGGEAVFSQTPTEAAVEAWGEFERQDEIHTMTWETLLLNCDKLAALHPAVGSNILGLRESPADARFTKCNIRMAVSPRDISGFVPKIETALGVLSQMPDAVAAEAKITKVLSSAVKLGRPMESKPERDAKIYNDWQAAKASGTASIAQFAKDRGWKPKQTATAIQRYKTRLSRKRSKEV